MTTSMREMATVPARGALKTFVGVVERRSARPRVYWRTLKYFVPVKREVTAPSQKKT